MLQFVVSKIRESKRENLSLNSLRRELLADFVRDRLGWTDRIVFSVHGGPYMEILFFSVTCALFAVSV